MQSDCLAVSPNLICSYAWKVPAARPRLFSLAESEPAADERRDHGANAKLGHPSLSWKAYLALREFQHLASDLAEAFFHKTEPVPPAEASEPSVLMTGRPERSLSGGRGLLAPVLADRAEAIAA